MKLTFKILTFLLLTQFSWAGELKNIDDYILAPDGRIGKIGTRIHNGRVVVSFHDKEKQTSHSENFSVGDVHFSLSEIQRGPGETTLKVGDYVSIKVEAQEPEKVDALKLMMAFFEEQLPEGTVFLQVEALFPDKVLLKSLQDKYNVQYTPKARGLYVYDKLEKYLGEESILSDIEDRIEFLSQSDFKRSIEQLDGYIDCLENEKCSFNIKERGFREVEKRDFSRFSLMVGFQKRERYFESLQIESSVQLMDLFKKQAVQYKLMTGLAHAQHLSTLKTSRKHYESMSFNPVKGLKALNFKREGLYTQAVHEMVRDDILSTRNFVNGMMLLGGVKITDPEDIFGTSESCNLSGCYDANVYRDMVRPMYNFYLYEMVKSQIYLPYLNWSLDKRDFLYALKQAKRGLEKTIEMMSDLKGVERRFLLTFTSYFEKVVSEFSIQKQELLRALIRVEVENQSFWKDLVREIKKPVFWGVMACYGVTVFTPAKFTNLLCHAAGLSIAGKSLMSNLQRTQTLNDMQKMQIVPLDTYNEALFGLVIETGLSLFYLKSTVPDFKSIGIRRANTPHGAISSQARFALQRTVLRNRGVKDTLDHIKQTLQKMLSGLLFTGQAPSGALMAEMLTPKRVMGLTDSGTANLYFKDLMSIGFLFSMILDEKIDHINYCVKFNINKDMEEEARQELMDLEPKLTREELEELFVESSELRELFQKLVEGKKEEQRLVYLLGCYEIDSFEKVQERNATWIRKILDSEQN